ncbi:alpha/beta hydrolase family protein [Sphaerisporangium rufum]|uniref:alpha/beta hydrolase family protein n=1 Tax=Sphaerisporangium rufum TaxID=1381558 RepID=UPI001EF201B2|nr:alpha/beta hydrolase [Sphaerisporangium rufum]
MRRALSTGLATTAALIALAAPATAGAASGTPPRPAAAPAGDAAIRVTAPPRLPAPTGPRPVGSTSLHLTDTARPDPWVAAARTRELMVTVWYPARITPKGTRAPYMTPKESEITLKGADVDVRGLPVDILSRTRTHSIRDAAPAGRRHGRPLVVLSPGYGLPRGSLTGLAEDLASHGYMVAGIDHTYESAATEFPGGRLATCVTCEQPHGPDFWKKLTAVRAADVSFVLDELTGAKPAWRGGPLIDPARVAVVGHSAGGAAALAAMVADPRLRAGIDMDGTTMEVIPATGLARPFLFLGQPDHAPGGRDTSWDRDWRLLTGWKRWLVLAGAAHASFHDFAVIGEQLGIDDEAELPGARAMTVTRRYVRAFLDRHLLGRPQPLLDRPSARYPEIRLCSVAEKTCA